MDRPPADTDADGAPRTGTGATGDTAPAVPARRGWLAAAVLLTLAGLALLVLVTAGWAGVAEADRAVAERLHRTALTEPGWTRANRILTDWIWDPITMRLLTGAVAVALWALRARREAWWLVAASAVGWLVQQGLKLAVARERPRWSEPVDSAHGWAFPSGHAMTATLTCGLLLVLLLPRVRSRTGRTVLWTVAVVSSAGVGFTRAYLGVHWSSDVVAGWLWGVAVVAFAVALTGARPGGAPPPDRTTAAAGRPAGGAAR